MFKYPYPQHIDNGIAARQLIIKLILSQLLAGSKIKIHTTYFYYIQWLNTLSNTVWDMLYYVFLKPDIKKRTKISSDTTNLSKFSHTHAKHYTINVRYTTAIPHIIMRMNMTLHYKSLCWCYTYALYGRFYL